MDPDIVWVQLVIPRKQLNYVMDLNTTDALVDSVLSSLDGEDPALYPYLPYLFQDLDEFGATPSVVLELITQHLDTHRSLKILELGCGKGAVILKLAENLHCRCVGIDAVPDFITRGIEQARNMSISDRCQFICADVRKKIAELKNFDVVIFSAIGPFLGDYFTTMSQTLRCLTAQGFILIDEAYTNDLEDSSSTLTKSALIRDMRRAGMRYIDELIIPDHQVARTNQQIYRHLNKRAQQLMQQYPEKRKLFQQYLEVQQQENIALESSLICSTLLFQRNAT